MIGTSLIETLVQAVSITHKLKGQKRVSLLLIAAPESGKTTVTAAATAKHVVPVAVMSGRSILKEVNEHPETEFLLFNDLTSVRAMSPSAVNLVIVLLNQLTQDERGIVAFAGKDVEMISRPIGIIGCIPFTTFTDHRARWKELGFVSRMLPFSYNYGKNIVAEIKDGVDDGTQAARSRPGRKMPKLHRRAVLVSMPAKIVRKVRNLADARATELDQLGIRLLQNYHALIRAHALLHGRRAVSQIDFQFLKSVDAYVSITDTASVDV